MKLRSTLFIPLILLTACESTYRDMTDTYVDGDKLYMSGTLNAQTYDEVEELLELNPQIKTVVLEHIDGSIDDEINLQTGLMIYNAGLNTYLPSDGFIESGAVDIMCAGKERIIERGAHVGVHSWADDEGGRGDELPKDHAEHEPYLDYFSEVDCGPEFYWFTLDAAGPDDMHIMTEQEWLTYGVATQVINARETEE